MGVAMINPDLRRKIKVKKRPDLIINRARYGGQHYFVVKDPVALRYYRFREEELFLLDQFDGVNTLDDIRHLFVEKFRPQRISVAELERFAGQLLQAGIATADTPMLGQRLYERQKQIKNNKIKQFFLNILYIKIPVFDPERLLTRMLPYTWWVFTIPFFLCACALGFVSLMLILVNWQTFISKLPAYHDFFTWRNLGYMWITLGVVKVLHEFGHGIACKRFGGEVHEMGFLMLVMTPALYCSVTDAWMLPNKWHRVIIGAGGMYVELILSSLFVLVWWNTEPGLLNTISLAIIFICSVSTVLFNANPLLRFDGYYILSDFLEIPNLRERSNKYLGNVASEIFLGAEVQPDPYMPTSWRWLFPIYAVAAYIYRWVITASILIFLYTFLKPYKLGDISAMLATGAVFTMFIYPLYSTFKLVRQRWRTMKVKKLQMALSLTLAAAALATLLLIPIPMRIHAPLILQPRDAATVFIEAPGVLTELNCVDGMPAIAGAVLGRLSDPELAKQYERARVEYERSLKNVAAYKGMDQFGKASEAELRAATSREMMMRLHQQLDKLVLKAPPGKSGVVMAPPKPKDIGTTMKAGQIFCQIGDPKELDAYIVLEHSDTSLVRPGSRVWVKLAGHVGPIIETKIDRISARELDSLPPALSNKHGGEVATQTDQNRQAELPMFKSYSLDAPVPNPDGSLTVGVRGIARLDIGYHSIAWRILRYLRQTFHFRL